MIYLEALSLIKPGFGEVLLSSVLTSQLRRGNQGSDGGRGGGRQLFQQEPLLGDSLSLVSPEEESWGTRYLAKDKENILLPQFCSVWGLRRKGQGRK